MRQRDILPDRAFSLSYALRRRRRALRRRRGALLDAWQWTGPSLLCVFRVHVNLQKFNAFR